MSNTHFLAPCQYSSVSEIIDLVSISTGIPTTDITGPWRRDDIIRARHLAMWVARHATDKSFPQIARVFKRDHTTVLYAIGAFEKRCQRDPGLRTLANWLVQSVRGNRAVQSA